MHIYICICMYICINIQYNIERLLENAPTKKMNRKVHIKGIWLIKAKIFKQISPLPPTKDII